MKKLFLSVAAAILAFPVLADEGMWLLPLLKQQKFAEMQALGLRLSDQEVYSAEAPSLKDAVVRFGGGCTGEMISPEMQNPDITKPAGAGDVPEANYKMIAALAVKKGQIARTDIS